MKIIKSSFKIEDEIDGEAILRKIEMASRNCYKSEERIGDIEKTKLFIKSILNASHTSVIEHVSITVRIICDRGVSHEIVRHRIASYSQESTRYCNYGCASKGMVFIAPCFWEEGSEQYKIWEKQMQEIEESYELLMKNGATAQQARSILPNSLKTEIICTMNLRSWRNFFTLRCSTKAHPQIREIAIPLLEEFKKRIPVIFDDITY